LQQQIIQNQQQLQMQQAQLQSQLQNPLQTIPFQNTTQSNQHIQQQQQEQQPPQPPQPTLEETLASLFQNANEATDFDRDLVMNFLRGDKTGMLPNQPIRTVTLHKEKKEMEGKVVLETVLFEMNYESGTWRKLKRCLFVCCLCFLSCIVLPLFISL
jgi:hypothetical protein